MITLRFVTSNDAISAAIRTWENDSWPTHVETQLTDGTLLGAHAEGGVAIRPLGYDKDTLIKEQFVKLTLTTLDMETKFYSFCKEQVGKPYDFTAIAGLALNRNWREDDSWFCSELMAAALESCGYFNELSSITSHISPRDLFLILSSTQKLT